LNSNSSENSKVKRAAIGYTIGNYLLRGLSFLTIPIFSRLLSPTDYGIYNTYIAYEGILFIVLGLALHSSFKNARMKYGEYLDAYISSCTILCGLNFLVILLLGNIINGIFHICKSYYLWILVIHSFSSSLLTYFNEYVSLRYAYKKFLLLSFLNALGNVVISIVLILTLFYEDRALGRILGTMIPLLGIAIFVIVSFWKRSRPRINKIYWKYALLYSLPIIPHGISQVVLSQFDRVMISFMVGNSEAGIYSFAFNVSAIISVTYSSIGIVWAPWFYEQMANNKVNDIKSYSKKYAFVIAVFTVGIMLLSPEIILILGTTEYRDAVYLTVPIILGGFFSYMYTFPAQVEYYFEKTQFIAIGTVGAATLNIVLNYIFIKMLGYQAAAYTTMMTFMAYFLFHYIISKKISNKEIYDLKSFIIIIAFVLLMGVLTQLILRLMVLRWILGFVMITVFLVFMNRRLGKSVFLKTSFTKK